MEKVERELNGKTLAMETGRLAKQSNGAVVVTHGDSAVLVTVNRDKPREGIDFFPLTVDYVEKGYAAGRIPGGFLKRGVQALELKLEQRRMFLFARLAAIVHGEPFVTRAVQDAPARAGIQLAYGHVQRNARSSRQGSQHPLRDVAVDVGPQ